MADRVEVDIVPKPDEGSFGALKKRINAATSLRDQWEKEVEWLKSQYAGTKFQSPALKAAMETAQKNLEQSQKNLQHVRMGGRGPGESGTLGTLASGGLATAGDALSTLSALPGIMQRVESFTRYSNPATAQRLDMAFNDMWAVIGQRLEPALDLWTDAVRIGADLLNAILPSQEEMRQALDELRPVLEELKDVGSEAAPIIKNLFVSAVQDAAQALRLFAGIARALFGWAPGKQLQSTVGFAAGHPSFIGGQDISKQAILGAMMAGRSTPAERTAISAEGMFGEVKMIREGVDSALRLLSKIPGVNVDPDQQFGARNALARRRERIRNAAELGADEGRGD